MAMSELIVYGITKRSIPHFLDNDREFYHLLVFVVFSKLIFFAVIYVLMHLMQKPKKNTGQYDKSVFLFIFIPLTSIFIMFIFISIGESVPLSSSLDWMIAVGAVFLLAANLLVFGINQYNQKKNMEFTEMQLLLQQESDSAQYYEMLNSILCRYMQQCTDSHITFHADIRSRTMDFIADNDLTSLFCNLLDNAIAAAGIVPDSFIEINTSKHEKTSFVVITVINSCRKNPFSGKGRQLSTDKTDKIRHGFGLKSIHKTVSKYHGNMQMYYNDDTLTFHTIITLKQQEL